MNDSRAEKLGKQRSALRVAMVTETYPPEVNGVARTIGIMVDGLRARGHSVELVRPRQRTDTGVEQAQDIAQILVAGFPIPRYTQLKMGLPAKRALLRAWTGKRPDVVHVATEGPLGWAAIAAARSLRIPVATDFHTNFHAYSAHYGFPWLSRTVAGYLRLVHNRADCTMVPTDELAETLAGQGFERLRVVGRGVHPDVFSPGRRSLELRRRWGAHDDSLVVLCVSRFAPEKNFPLVIEAFDAMRQVNPRCQLVLVGDGPLRKGLERQGAGFVIAGRLVNGELSAHYASADAFVFPSTTETFGNVTLEAMASGLAIVAYRYAAARQYLEHERTALLAPFNNRAAFIEQAQRLARDPLRARALGDAARRVAEGLSWERTVDDFEAVLRDTASGTAALAPTHAPA